MSLRAQLAPRLIRVFTDEDVFGHLARGLRASGLDAVSAPEASRLGFSDESQLLWARTEARMIVTFSDGDFARIHNEWLTRGESHSGIIVSKRASPGSLISRILHLSQSLEADDMLDRLEYLSNW